jgi:CubicO group peptidase (beta-lactamase class C family)
LGYKIEPNTKQIFVTLPLIKAYCFFKTNLNKMKIFCVAIICFFNSYTLHAQNNRQKLSKKLAAIQASTNLPGFSVAVIKNNALAFTGGFGFANKKTKVPYTINTIQPVGSVSKTIIALALIKAVELHYFNLQSTINSILPFAVINPNFTNTNIIINHLVTHTSSLLDDEETYTKTYSIGKTPNMPLGQFLKAYYTPRGQWYKPTNFDTAAIGSTYHYSNIAAALAAYIIEVKSGMSFDAFTQKYIFTPLKMSHTHWHFSQQKSKQYATLYEVNTAETPFIKGLINTDGSLQTYSCITYPDGSLKTSIADLSTYMLAMLKGYNGDSGILSKNGFATLFAKQFTATTMPLNMDTKEVNRAVFWCYTKKGDIRHTGSDPGLMAFVSINPTKNIARAFMLNTSLDGEDNAATVKAFMQIINALDAFEKELN